MRLLGKNITHAHALCIGGGRGIKYPFSLFPLSRMLQLNSPCVSLWASVSQVEVPVDDTKEEEEVREQGDEQQAQGQDSEQKADQDEEQLKQGQEENPRAEKRQEAHAHIHVATNQGASFIIEMTPSGASVYQSPLKNKLECGPCTEGSDPPLTELFRCVTQRGNLLRQFQPSQASSPTSQLLRADGVEMTTYVASDDETYSSWETITAPQGLRWERMEK